MKEHIEVEYKGLQLRGYHQKANDRDVVIITHGIGGNKLGHKYVFKQMADACEKSGISTIRMDFLGSGESDGKFEELTHSDQIEQVKQLIKTALEKYEYSNIYLCSTTIGCYSVWHAAEDCQQVKAVINWNPITNFDRYYNNAKSKADVDGGIDYSGLYSNPTYLEDLQKLQRKIPMLTIPVLFLQGENDKEFSYDDAREVCKQRGWKYIQVDEGNHLWEGSGVRAFLFGSTIKFIKDNQG